MSTLLRAAQGGVNETGKKNCHLRCGLVLTPDLSIFHIWNAAAASITMVRGKITITFFLIPDLSRQNASEFLIKNLVGDGLRRQGGIYEVAGELHNGSA